MWYVVVVVAAVVALATYLTWIATRVDRLHQGVTSARAALDIQSARRAAAAAQLGEREHLLDAQEAALVLLAAHTDVAGSDLPRRVEAENRLTKVLRQAVEKFDAPTVADIIETSRRLALARQVHSDRVRDARAMRRRRLVRLLRLARRHEPPEFYDIEDPALDAAR